MRFELDFDIGNKLTRVTSRLDMRRNPESKEKAFPLDPKR
jgi:hypothetical protein